MASPDKGSWMKNGGGYPDTETSYDNSLTIEPKRAHQWFLDSSDAELFPSKKPAVEGSNGRPVSGVPNVNLSWEGPSTFQSVTSNITERLFRLEPPRAIDFGGRHFINAGNLEIGRRAIEDQYGTGASIALSISHTMEDPVSCLTYGGIRKVKVNQVKDPDSGISTHMGNTFTRGDCNSISFNGFEEAHEANPQPCRQNRIPDSSNSTSFQMGNNFSRFDNNTISFCGFQDENETKAQSGRVNQVKDNHSIMSMQLGNTFGKGDSNTKSCSGSPVEPAMSNYDLITRQSYLQHSEFCKEKEVVNTTNTELVVNVTPVAAIAGDTVKAKNDLKLPKKAPPPNSFPSNVRSLLNTGILDGVPVKYVSWQHEKELGGIIKGCGYRCGCNLCNYTKALNAYEFEKHAGARTKHPNNHIYVENGKTIYSIVQELKTTPPNMLFEAIQNCTGSPINHKAFNSWKESYQAATRELERIYGKDLLSLSTQNED